MVIEPAQIELLVRRISETFSGVPAPDKNALTVCKCEECNEYSEMLKGIPWQDQEQDKVGKSGFQLALLSDAAFRYYLPAYLICSLSADPRAYDVLESTIVYLGGDRPEMLAQIPPFEMQEVKVIIEFLEFIQRFHEEQEIRAMAETALLSYWWPLNEAKDQKNK